MNAVLSHAPTWMGGERPWFLVDPNGRLVTKEGGGFVDFATHGEAERFAGLMESGAVKLNSDGRVPLATLEVLP